MAEQNFVDYVKICCRSGAGGAGMTHFYRDKFTTKGGPDGGDGGRGGHIILRGNRNMWTLLALKYRKHVIAERGHNGSDGNKTGGYGNDVILDVPLGTVAKDSETGEIHFEITRDGEKRILVSGGRGGLGNSNFKSSTNQTPRYSQPGEPGREEWKILELKVLADVGLVGFPNAGKSTLLSVITAAKPEIGAYPFTTLVPNLGIVQYRDGRSFIMADIPGIIEDAHLGRGLGHRFLRHVERNSTLLFLIPCDSDNIGKEFDILMNELEMYNPELLDKPRILAITKCDMIDPGMQEEMKADLPEGVESLFISSVANQGLEPLKDLLWTTINAHSPPPPPEPDEFYGEEGLTL
ncbi:MAG: GTPase ObgE [Saprospiraceae bacterium]|nr:GTPase ObgE [Saprospiraceae bacterium]MDZ4703991.1 GTPase ObgE [Saprospiraceae bacterium]